MLRYIVLLILSTWTLAHGQATVRGVNPTFADTIPEVTKKETTEIMLSIRNAETAFQKEKLLLPFMERVKKAKANFVSPMLNMMISQTAQAFYQEGSIKKGDEYALLLEESYEKRDLYFLSGIRCQENELLKPSEYLLEKAASLSIRLNTGKELSEIENANYPTVLAAYANLLVKTGQIKKAVPYAQQAYSLSTSKDFTLMDTYVSTLIYENKYLEVIPILEQFIKEGKATAQHLTWLKKSFEIKFGTTYGFDTYINELKQISDSNLQAFIDKEMINEVAPDFTLCTLQGDSITLSSLKGKIVILDFWATWCGPCKASFPAMHKASLLFDKKDVVFLFINTLEKRKDLKTIVQNYLSEKGYDFTVLFDMQDRMTKKYSVIESYGAKGIPAKYIIDAKGNIRFRLLGFSGSDEKTVKELELMIKKCQSLY